MNGWLGRWLLVRDDERATVRHFLILALLLGAGLALGRGSAETLFFKRYGIEHLPVMYALLGGLLAVSSLAYAVWADRLAGERLTVIMLVTLASLLGVSWSLMNLTGSDIAYPLYFLLYEVASELLVAQATLYLAQNIDTQQGKRLFPLVFAGLQGGKVIGGLALSVAAGTIGVANLPLVWIGLIVVGGLAVRRFHRRYGHSPYARTAPRRRSHVRHAIHQIEQGLRFAVRTPLVRAMAGSLFCLVLAYSLLSYAVGRYYTGHFADEAALGAFLGTLAAVSGALALVLQLFVTGRLLESAGPKHVNTVFPLTTAASFAVLLMAYSLPATILGSLNKDALLPAIRNPTRNLFMSVLPASMQGRVRALSLALVLPAAMLVGGILLMLLQNAATPAWYLAAGLIASLGYLAFNVSMNRAYLGAILTTLRERLFLPGAALESALQNGGEELAEQLARGVGHADDDIALAYARLLAERFPGRAGEAIVARLTRAAAPVRTRLLALLTHEQVAAYRDRLFRTVINADEHYRAELETRLLEADLADNAPNLSALLQSHNPRIRAAGIAGALRTGDPLLQESALAAWRALLGDADPGARLAGLRLCARGPRASMQAAVCACLDDPVERVQIAALDVLRDAPAGWRQQVQAPLMALTAHPRPTIRARAITCLHHRPAAERRAIAASMIEDAHPEVRDAAIALWRHEHPDFTGEIIDILLAGRGSPRAQTALLASVDQDRLPPEACYRVAERKLEECEQLGAQRARLLAQLAGRDDAPAVLRLLTVILAERRQQTLDLALRVLERSEDRHIVQLIRAALNDEDRRQRANALEALHHLRHRSITERLARLLDLTERAIGPAAGDAAGVRAILDWCMARPDPWLRECATAAARG